MFARHKVDEYYMRRAISLAWRGKDETSPNPMVGCVLVQWDRDNSTGRVIGEGYHARRGGAHAEVAALDDAARRGEDVRGATAYVTLEPCSHFGKTPPCAPCLVREGIARVVAGSEDPNPQVRGEGFKILRNAGVEVSAPCLERECKWMNRGFFRRHTLGRPWITLKAAASLDGRMALASGESRWITGAAARRWAHLLRAEHDGILVGIGTVLADDPELTVRYTCGKSPLRIILNTSLSLMPNFCVLTEGCLVLIGRGDKAKISALEKNGVEVCKLPIRGGCVDLNAALEEIVRHNVQLLMVEGGPRVLSSFIKKRLCDSLALFTAPSLMGEGYGLGEGLRFDFMDDVIHLKETRARHVGNDLLVEGIFQCSPAL
jgi:diaminohydroxyphosphoribosylaminopyrimidine deaminase/5-amino-6-(5-phosphoribosylamino)uracil reductase